MGVLVPLQDLSILFVQGQTLAVSLHFPQNQVHLEGKIRNMLRLPEYTRLAIEFTGTVPEKAVIIRFVMQRRSEIMSEVRQLYEQVIRQKDIHEG
jgi:hypothetical protein